MNKEDIITTLQNSRNASVKHTPDDTEAIRAQIAQDVENFLKSGGTIQQIPVGVVAEYQKKAFKIS